MKNYQVQTFLGFLAFFLARFFEVSTYFLVSEGIDLIDELLEGTTGSTSIAQIVLGIVSCVGLRSCSSLTLGARFAGSALRYPSISVRCCIDQSSNRAPVFLRRLVSAT